MRHLSAVHLPVRLLAGVVLILLAHRPVAAQPGTVTLSGHVANGAGTASAGVMIAVTDGAALPPLTTDAVGGFMVSGVAPGVYTVTPSRPGFV